MTKLSTRAVLLVLVPAAALIGCGGGGTGTPPAGGKAAAPGGGGTAAPAAPASRYNLEIPMVTYKWDPQAGDKSVPADQGGPGFTGEGWTTNMTFLALGDPRAVKGGTYVRYLLDWPATLRQTGKDWNESFNYTVADMCYQGLLQYHKDTLEWIPMLATHWQISDDRMTYRFRMNPKARWSDGSEVTADDVVATFKLLMDPTLLDPSAIMTFEKMEAPVAKSKYIVEVKAKEENWRNFLYFATQQIFPAKEVSIKGSEYLDKYQFAYTANSGPYIVDMKAMEQGQSLTIRRRPDWWDADNPAWAGIWNFDVYKAVIVKDPNLAFEKAKKGELDYFWVQKAQWWAEEVDKIDGVKRGLIQKRKICNDHPLGFSGAACNQLRPPLDDIRLRMALNHLFNRKLFIEKFFFHEYAPLDSYYQGGIYQNQDNPHIDYDEPRAVELLEQAGWKELNAEGYRMKGGKELKLTLNYASPLSERYLTVFQESCKKAGIRLDLQILTPAALFKNATQKEYDLIDVPWGALVFPNPETSFHSKLAREKDNNNITGFQDPEVDRLCAAYDKEYDPAKRAALIRQIDGLVYKQYPYVLGWSLPSLRFLVSSKVRMPEWGTWRTADEEAMHYCWWIDPEVEKEVEAAKADTNRTLRTEEVENHYWEAWDKAHTPKAATAGG